MRYGNIAAAVLLVTAAPAPAQDLADGGASAESVRTLSLPDAGVGRSMKVTTRNGVAQKHFDEGLAATYSNRHSAARRAFEESFRADQSCAMCAWGVAYALWPHIDLPHTDEERAAQAAIYAANALSGGATVRERDIIAALTKWFDNDLTREARDAAYRAALQDLAARHRDAPDIQVLVEDALSKLGHASEIRFGFASLPSGVRMRYAERGARYGDVIVLMHGYSDSWFSWSTIMPLVPEDLRVIAVDLRGHGLTQYEGENYSIDTMADDVAALLEWLGVRSATIVGHSMGSMVAQGIASRHADRVGRLVLVGAPVGRKSPALMELAELVLTFSDAVPDGFIREFQEGTAYGPVDPQFIERAIVESEHLSVKEWRSIAAGFGDVDYLDELASFKAPALLIWGDKDQYFPRKEQDALLAALPNARLITYEETGHAVHWERPERFAADLLAFVRGGSTSR